MEVADIMANPTGVAAIGERWGIFETAHFETRTKITVCGLQKLLNPPLEWS
jgi:hypothetical protein